MDTGLQKAITASGSIASLARALGITGAAICQWPRIPAGRVIAIEDATGVPRDQLRPDLYRRSRRASEARPSPARRLSHQRCASPSSR